MFTASSVKQSISRLPKARLAPTLHARARSIINTHINTTHRTFTSSTSFKYTISASKMSKLTDFKLLAFDVYGTIIDWERGALKELDPLIKRSPHATEEPKEVLKIFNQVELEEQKKNPAMKYAELLEKSYPAFATRIGCEEPTAEECKKFGESVGNWPPFPDSVEALHRLKKHYKLVVLSNVDNASFKRSLHNQLQDFPFDAVLTAEDIGSYKPNLKNFEYMFRAVKERFGIEKDEIMQTAQSQTHDHHPAHELGMKSTWIERTGAVMGNRDDPVYTWKFDTLGDMADAVEAEAAGK